MLIDLQRGLWWIPDRTHSKQRKDGHLLSMTKTSHRNPKLEYPSYRKSSYG